MKTQRVKESTQCLHHKKHSHSCKDEDEDPNNQDEDIVKTVQERKIVINTFYSVLVDICIGRLKDFRCIYLPPSHKEDLLVEDWWQLRVGETE